MYGKAFCKVYNEFGWNYFPRAFGEQLLEWLERNSVEVKTSLDLGCGTGLELDDLPALTLPVEMVIDADGKLESLSAETVYYEDYNYAEIEVNYANGHLQAAIRPYRMRNTYYVPQGAMELNLSADQNGGSVDFYFQEDEETTLHFFANYQLKGGKLWSADAQYTLGDYDTCTATLTYRPNSLIVTLYADEDILTSTLNWVNSNQSASYWLDVVAYESYYEEAYMISAQGRADWKNGLNHNLQLTCSDLERANAVSVSLNQRFVQEGNKYTHDVTATVSEMGQDGRNVSTPINWNTVIILK